MIVSHHVLARLSSSGDKKAAVDGKHGHLDLVPALILCHMRFGVDWRTTTCVPTIRLGMRWFVASRCVGCTVVVPSVSLRCVLGCWWFQKAPFYAPGSALVKFKHLLLFCLAWHKRWDRLIDCPTTFAPRRRTRSDFTLCALKSSTLREAHCTTAVGCMQHGLRGLVYGLTRVDAQPGKPCCQANHAACIRTPPYRLLRVECWTYARHICLLRWLSRCIPDTLPAGFRLMRRTFRLDRDSVRGAFGESTYELGICVVPVTF